METFFKCARFSRSGCDRFDSEPSCLFSPSKVFDVTVNVVAALLDVATLFDVAALLVVATLFVVAFGVVAIFAPGIFAICPSSTKLVSSLILTVNQVRVGTRVGRLKVWKNNL